MGAKFSAWLALVVVDSIHSIIVSCLPFCSRSKALAVGLPIIRIQQQQQRRRKSISRIANRDRAVAVAVVFAIGSHRETIHTQAHKLRLNSRERRQRKLNHQETRTWPKSRLEVSRRNGNGNGNSSSSSTNGSDKWIEQNRPARRELQTNTNHMAAARPATATSSR